jgi:hypothetical protein
MDEKKAQVKKVRDEGILEHECLIRNAANSQALHRTSKHSSNFSMNGNSL